MAAADDLLSEDRSIDKSATDKTLSNTTQSPWWHIKCPFLVF